MKPFAFGRQCVLLLCINHKVVSGFSLCLHSSVVSVIYIIYIIYIALDVI